MSDTMSGGRGRESSGSRRRRRRGGLWREITRRLGFVGRILRRFEAISRRPSVTAFPLFCYLFLGSVYFLAMIQMVTDINRFPMYWDSAAVENPAEKLSAELMKQKVQAVAYLLTFGIIAFRPRTTLAFFRSESTLLLLVVALALSAFGSAYPDRVAINVVHLLMGVLAAWVYFDDERRQRNIVYSACLITFLPVVFSLFASAVLFFLHPGSSIEAILGGQRFSGLGGNPNSLGGICIVGAWATFGLMALTPPKSRRMLFLVAGLAVVLFNAWTTGSATTLSIIAAMFLMTIGFRFYGLLGKKLRAGLILAAAVAFFGIVMLLVIQQSVDEYALAATEAVGKDLTLTGRTDLWMIAWEAFVERPVFGWGYDNHQTVLESSLYGVPYNHYHNGYLDTLVSGGVLLGAAVVISYTTFFRRYLAFNRTVDTAFPLVIAVTGASIQNMTEYSLFRGTNVVWEMYFIAFLAVAVAVVKPSKRVKSSRSESSAGSGRSGSRRQSW